MSGMVGRPTKYDKKYLNKIKDLIILGCSNNRISKIIGIDNKTLNNWREEHQELDEIMISSKENANIKVMKNMYKRANGYTYKETVIKDGEEVTYKKYMHPDVTAGKFILKSRQGWNEIEKTENININHNSNNNDISLINWFNALSPIEQSKPEEELIKDYERFTKENENS